METITYDVRVKLEEGYARPRWYTVANDLDAVKAGEYVSTYMASSQQYGDQGGVLAIEIVQRES